MTTSVRNSRDIHVPKVLLMLLFTGVLMPVVSASAHPPYEHTVRSLTDGRGATVDIVKSYIDGIVLTDPVKLVIRPNTGAVPIAKTNFARDISLLCWSRSDCLAFGFDAFLPFWPAEVWHVSTDGRTRADGQWIRVIGVFAPLWDHRVGYLVAFVLLALPAALFRGVLTSRETTGYRAFVQVCAAAVAAGWSFLWTYGVIFLSDLSFPLVLFVVALAIGLRRLWRQASSFIWRRAVV